MGPLVNILYSPFLVLTFRSNSCSPPCSFNRRYSHATLNIGRRLAPSPTRCTFTQNYWIRNFKTYVVLEVKQVSPIHDGVREIQTYTDVRVWENRAVLYTRSKIDVGVAFNVASSRDEALLRNL